MALIFRDTFQAALHNTKARKFSSFEYIDATLADGLSSVRCVIIYRPPVNSKALFLDEFALLLESLPAIARLLISGDFNINMNDSADSTVRKLSSALRSRGLIQHVDSPTPIHGGVIDLVMSRASDALVSTTWVMDILSDHFVVQCFLRFCRPVRRLVVRASRPYGRINWESFQSDLAATPFVSQPASSLEELLQQHEATVDVLDQHAPVRMKRCVQRDLAPWYNHEVSEARREVRKKERKWRRCRRSS